MSKHKSSPRQKSLFGLSGLIVAVLSAAFLIASMVAAELTITPETFTFWNNLTVAGYCVTVPIALTSGFIGFLRVNDSRGLSIAALVIAGVPFLVIFVQFVASFF
jgi:hypothetical protein